MKLGISKAPRGMILVMTLITIAILGVVLAAYVSLVNNQNLSVARSQCWNQAIPVCESGIEESLTQLYLAGTNTLLLTSNSWTRGADGLYHKSRTFSDGSYFHASIQPTVNPTIVSTGFVAVPSSSMTVSRRVRVGTRLLASTGGGLTAKTTINLSSHTYVDAFDSTDPLHSLLGQYLFLLAEQNATVVANSTAASAIRAGTIYGSAKTGPGGTVSGTVTGNITDDANVQLNDNSPPFTYGTGLFPVSGGTMQGGLLFAWVIGGGNYNMASLNLSGVNAMVILGDAVIYVNGNVNIAGVNALVLAPGATLTLYVNGSVSMPGVSLLNGAVGLAKNFSLRGLPGCTSINILGLGAFIGTINAPEAALSFADGATAIGAFAANSISTSGTVAFHVDNSLVSTTGGTYVLTSWNEF